MWVGWKSTLGDLTINHACPATLCEIAECASAPVCHYQSHRSALLNSKNAGGGDFRLAKPSDTRLSTRRFSESRYPMGVVQYLSRLFKPQGGEERLRVQRQTNRVVLFVHGLGSTPTATWDKIYTLFLSDPVLEDYSFECFSYPTQKVRLPFSVPSVGLLDLAASLRTEIEGRFSGSEIILVGHSLGGLVARQYLTSELVAGRALKVSKAFFYAVPNHGAEAARYGTALSSNNRQVELLRLDDDSVRRLNSDWTRLEVEQTIPVRFAVAGQDDVVNSLSARPLTPGADYDLLAGYNHTNVVKPSEPDDIRYVVLRNFIISDTKNPTPEQHHPNTPLKTPDPLFDIYSEADELFYIGRETDDRIAAVLRGSHAWISGDSGVGKTAAVTRCISQFKWRQVHIMLSSYQDQSPLGLLRAMCIELSDLCGSTNIPPVTSSLADLVSFFRKEARNHPAQSLGVFVEEIPLAEQSEFDAFSEMMLSLVQALEADPGTKSRVILVFSSIKPVFSTTGAAAKLRENIVPMTLPSWTTDDLRRLVERICTAMRPSMPASERGQIAAAAEGSPRFVKRVFMRWRNGTDGGVELETLLESVKAEFSVG